MRLPILLYFLLRICCSLEPHLYAQSDTDFILEFDRLDKKDGLSNDTYNDFLFKDSQGYLWVSSMQGIYQYDGNQFTHYSADENVASSMKGNNVQSDFYEDENANIWFSTYLGINKYDRSLDKVIGYSLTDENEEIIESNYHIFHIDTTQRVLWVFADTKIYHYNYLTKKVVYTIPFIIKSMRFSARQNKEGQVTQIFGTPWALASGFELLSLKDGQWSYDYRSLEKELGPNKVSDLLHTQASNWLVSNKGLVKLNKDGEYEDCIKLKNRKDQYFYKGLKVDADHLLLSTYKDGLHLLDIGTESLTPFKATIEGEGLTRFCDLYLDQDSILWTMFHSGGIGRADLRGRSLQARFKKLYSGKGLKSIYHAEKTYLINDRNELIIIDNRHNDRILLKRKLDIDVRALSINKDGQVILIDRNSIYTYDPVSSMLKQEQKVNFELINVHTINEVHYLSTFNGLYAWSTAVDTLQSLAFDKVKNIINPSLIACIFTSESECLIPYNAKMIKAVKFDDTSIKVNRSAPFKEYIYDAKADGLTWYFVSVSGLYKWDNNSKIEKLEYQHYLPAMGFNSLVLMDKENLLLGNAEGVYSYSLVNSKLRKLNYLFADELSIIKRGLHKIENDSICIASTESCFCILSKDIAHIEPKLDLNIKSLEINNRVQIRPNLLHGLESKIVLGHNDHFLGLQLQSKDQLLKGGGEIRYKDDRSNLWQTLSNGKLSFENLLPGEFKLSFVALDKNLNASVVKALNVKVKESFFKSPFFILLMALLVALISYTTGKIIEKVKSDKLQQKLEIQLTREQERSRIASMIHDDMGAILSTIQFASEDLSMDIEDEALKQKAIYIENDAKDLLSRMRSNIWALKTDTKYLEELVYELKKSAHDQALMFGLEIEFSQPETFPKISLSGATCLEIMLVQKEALNNVAKHARATKVRIDSSCTAGKLNIKIKDDGVGLPNDLMRGMGLTNMEKRANTINGQLKFESKGEGFAVDLTVPVENGN